MSSFRDLESKVPLKNFEVPGLDSYFQGPRSRVPLNHIRVLGQRSHLGVLGPVFPVLRPTFLVCLDLRDKSRGKRKVYLSIFPRTTKSFLWFLKFLFIVKLHFNLPWLEGEKKRIYQNQMSTKTKYFKN